MRRTEVYTVESNDRDNGKTFLITEMDADKSEKWAARALNALASSGIAVPDGAGLSELASIGLDSFRGLPWGQVEPLLDEMFGCIQFIPDPQRKTAQYPLGYPRPLHQSDIEEVMTRLKLRVRVLELHLGFSIADKFSSLSAKKVGEPQMSTPTSQG